MLQTLLPCAHSLQSSSTCLPAFPILFSCIELKNETRRRKSCSSCFLHHVDAPICCWGKGSKNITAQVQDVFRATTLSSSTKREGRDQRGFSFSTRKERTDASTLSLTPVPVTATLDCFVFDPDTTRHTSDRLPQTLQLFGHHLFICQHYQRWGIRLVAIHRPYSRQGQH